LGGGASTAFWVNRGHEVTVIETDNNWASTIEDNLKGSKNLNVFVCPDINASALQGLNLGEFDVVVNDFSGDRAQVAHWILLHLNKGGVVVWDNSDREEYRDGLRLLRESGMGWISFFGLGPVNSQAWETTILSTSLLVPTWPVREKRTIRY
jgi:precorrin-6B methylase 2